MRIPLLPQPAARPRLLGVSALAVAGLVLLSGCGTSEPAPKPDNSSSPSASASPSASPEAAPGEEPTAAPETPADEATPIGLGCAELITLDDLYNFNPNFAHIDETPAAGTPGARAVAAKGVACTYMNLSSNETIVVAASTPGDAALGTARAEKGSATAISGLGDEAWFSGGTTTVISGAHLLTVTSVIFTTPEDGEQLTRTALSHLG